MGVSYSKMGRQIIQSSDVSSCLMLKLTLKRSDTGGGGIMNCNKTSHYTECTMIQTEAMWALHTQDVSTVTPLTTRFLLHKSRDLVSEWLGFTEKCIIFLQLSAGNRASSLTTELVGADFYWHFSHIPHQKVWSNAFCPLQQVEIGWREGFGVGLLT